MADGKTKITPTIDLTADGKQMGNLMAPWSRDSSAWGSLCVPIAVIGRGAGPAVLFTGGNHGDEYEGPTALINLIRELEPADVSGRVIVMPMLNFPAVEAGTRTSPIDGGNMNRAFPGRRDGTLTEQVAHFVTTEILPRVDAVVDIHSGGKTLYFSPFGAVHALPDAGQSARARAALAAFAPPIALTLVELDAEGMLDTMVEEAGKLFVTTELAGGGTATPATVEIAARGVRNILKHLGIIEGKPVMPEDIGLQPTRWMETPDDGFVACRHPGLLEMLVDVGDEVIEGHPIARVHDIADLGSEPEPYLAPTTGLLIGRHHPGLIARGDFLALVAKDA